MSSIGIAELTALGAAPATNDLLVIVDVSDTSQSLAGSTKNLTVANLFAALTSVSAGLNVVGNLTVNTNKLTVNATTGNTVVAGTLSVVGLASLTGGLSVSGGNTALTTLSATTTTLSGLLSANNGLSVSGGNATFSLAVTVTGTTFATGGLIINGGAFAAGALYKDANYGLATGGITGVVSDWTVFNPSGATPVLTIPTGTTNLALAGLIELTAAATARTGSTIGLGGTTQTTIGANGAASALTANPLGYLIFFKGATKCVLPYYNG